MEQIKLIQAIYHGSTVITGALLIVAGSILPKSSIRAVAFTCLGMGLLFYTAIQMSFTAFIYPR